MPNTSPRLVAGGDIKPSRFVMISTDNTGIQATGAADDVIGISMEGTNKAPKSDDLSEPLAATTGQYFKLYGDGDECLITAGAAITAGARLTSDADGRGVTATAANASGAIALEAAAAADELVRVQVNIDRAPA